MPQLFSITLIAYICFIVEHVFAEFFGGWFTPDLLIILIVFFNLYRGIRYSLIVALIAGVLKDSVGVHPFGIHIFAYMLCAYISSFIKMYFYQVGSSASRVLMVFLISLIHVIVQYILHLMFMPLKFGDMFVHVLVPEVFATTLIAGYAFERFKQCALRLFA